MRDAVRWLPLVASVLVWAVGCTAPAKESVEAPSERAVLLTDALRWYVPTVLGDRDLSEWLLVVDAGADSGTVVQRMGHPSFTVTMPTDVERDPIYTTDRQSGRHVVRLNLKVTAVSESTATVVVTFFSGSRNASSSRLELVPEADGWRVVSGEQLWVA
jgi:hypothetical protein